MGIGVHDVGGEPGYGAPALEFVPVVEGSAFAERWEAAVFTMMRCIGGAGVTKNTDQFRHAVERVDAQTYFAHGYYGRWLGGLETLLVEAGALEREALDARVGELALSLGATQEHVDELLAEGSIASQPLTPADVEVLSASVNPSSSVRYLSQPPKFVIGDQVTAIGFEGLSARRGANQRHVHTRLPNYARGASGEIVAWHRGWVLPDTNAHLGLEEPAHLYGVAFSARELYGASAEEAVAVHLDLFEPYLVGLDKED